MTTTEIIAETKVVAEERDIAQYKAMMLEYVKQSKIESDAKKTKEKLKEKIKKALGKIGVRAAMVQIPDNEQFAVAYSYTQSQPQYDHDLLHKLVAAEIVDQIHHHGSAECFTVVKMDEMTARERVEKSNEVDEVPTPSKQH